MPGRRHVLKAAGSFAALGLVGDAAARPFKPGAEEIGILDEVDSLIESGKTEQARALLEKHGVPYDLSVKSVNTARSSGSGDSRRKKPARSIEPAWSYNDPDENPGGVQVYSWLYNHSGDRWVMNGRGRFPDEEWTEDNSEYRIPQGIPDACGIVFDHAEWSAPQPSEDGVTYYDDRHCKLDHDEYNPNYGVTAKAKWEGQLHSETDTYVGMRTTLDKDTSEDATVQFVWEHTLYPTDLLPGGISISVGAGGLSVTLPTGGVTDWREEVTSRT